MLADFEITALCQGKNRMISPFVDQQVRSEGGRGVISYGLSSYGYDIRLQNEIRILKDVHGGINPKNGRDEDFYTPRDHSDDVNGTFVEVPPHTVALGHSIEYFTMPPDVTGIAYGKSTLVRSGVHVFTATLEAGWEGHLVIEIANLTPKWLWLHLYEGIAQVQFQRGRPCTLTYPERGGKYHKKRGITHSKV